MDLSAIQSALRDAQLDGWLFYDFHNRDAIAARLLKMDTSRFASRRWFYYLPARGEPRKLVHKIEPWRCDHLPGDRQIYLSWRELQQGLETMLAGAKKIAMQVSPLNAIPYVSIVDAGTADLVRGFGIELVSSADLVARFEARLSAADWESHQEAGRLLQAVKDETFAEIGRRIRAKEEPGEFEIQAFMHDRMREGGLTWEDGPIVAVNEHAADPHYEPAADVSVAMREGDLVLIDLWARLDRTGSIYYDITWMGFIGDEVPARFENVFQVARRGRDGALEFLRTRLSAGETVRGCDVDDVCRGVIVEAGYGDYFTHRTGHSIGEQVHANGVNIDNLETRDERRIAPGSCFSIEPGIYMPEKKMGFRTEVDVYISEDSRVQVSGAIQESIIPILTLPL